MDILEALWGGEIQPQEDFIKNDPDYAAALHAAARGKDRLLANLSPQEREAIDSLTALQLEVSRIAELDAFRMGFRLAVRLMLAGYET